MRKSDIGIKEIIFSLLLFPALILFVVALWFIVLQSPIIFAIAVIVIVLLSASIVVWDFLDGPLFDIDLTNFVPQTVPITAASALSGWVTYRMFMPVHYDGRLEENSFILILSLIVTIFSIINFCEAMYPLKYCQPDSQREFRNDRLKLLLIMLLIHGVVMFLIGFWAAKLFSACYTKQSLKWFEVHCLNAIF